MSNERGTREAERRRRVEALTEKVRRRRKSKAIPDVHDKIERWWADDDSAAESAPQPNQNTARISDGRSRCSDTYFGHVSARPTYNRGNRRWRRHDDS